jgi:hypothetical protein
MELDNTAVAAVNFYNRKIIQYEILYSNVGESAVFFAAKNTESKKRFLFIFVMKNPEQKNLKVFKLDSNKFLIKLNNQLDVKLFNQDEIISFITEFCNENKIKLSPEYFSALRDTEVSEYKKNIEELDLKINPKKLKSNSTSIEGGLLYYTAEEDRPTHNLVSLARRAKIDTEDMIASQMRSNQKSEEEIRDYFDTLYTNHIRDYWTDSKKKTATPADNAESESVEKTDEPKRKARAS